jgi:hypothetical protein
MERGETRSVDLRIIDPLKRKLKISLSRVDIIRLEYYDNPSYEQMTSSFTNFAFLSSYDNPSYTYNRNEYLLLPNEGSESGHAILNLITQETREVTRISGGQIREENRVNNAVVVVQNITSIAEIGDYDVVLEVYDADPIWFRNSIKIQVRIR